MKKILSIIFLCFVFQGFSNFSILNDKIDVPDSSHINNKINHSIGFELGGTFLFQNLFYDMTFNLKNDNFVGIGFVTPIYVVGNFGWGYGFKSFYGFGKNKSSKISLTYGNIVNIRSMKSNYDENPWDQPPIFYHVFSLYSGQYFNLKDSKFSLFYNVGGNLMKYKKISTNGGIKKRNDLFPFFSLGFQYKIK